RTLRWTPLLVFVALVAGYAMLARSPSVLTPDFWIAWLLFYGAFLAAHFVRLAGPRFTPSAREPLDERELTVKVRAHAISGMLFAGTAMFGCFYMAAAGTPGLWHPQGWYDWFNLGFGIQAAATLLPTWVASWLEPRPITDLED
ncbi:hypothetical protein, partial [Parasphingorhabdus sp.]|uniref:hypothetical protein n=1 Tax=Parasphingorhabdus sp. TaxID=2709688 RepID=UPI003002B6B7